MLGHQRQAQTGPGPGAPPARGRTPVEAIEHLGPLDGADTRAGIFDGDLDDGMGSVVLWSALPALCRRSPRSSVPPSPPVHHSPPATRHHSPPPAEEPSGPTVVTEITVAPPP